MPDSPLVSVVVPAFNHAAYVGETLRSIASQTCPNIEIVVVDDGSCDATADIAEQTLANSGRPQRLIRQSNQGAHVALNRGLAEAAGDYLTILNSDDLFHPERIARLIEAARSHQADWLFTSITHFARRMPKTGRAGRLLDEYRASTYLARSFPTIGFELLRYNYVVTTGNLFFKRAHWESVGEFRPLRICHDWDFILRSLALSEPLWIDEPLLRYRLHESNTVTSPEGIEQGAHEGVEVLRNYFERVREPANPQAPCRSNWNAYWPYFCRTWMSYLPSEFAPHVG
jgi:glycosyltransferase involved in cell wall biosynthesis